MSELQQAINEMRNMRESYDQIGAAAEAYNVGKPKLAANINAKGVQASASETLPELAEKVAAISQETYEINGGEMYAKQLFGSLETPNYWNLYDVLTQLLSDGRLVQYGGILLGEFYKGYASIELSGAGAGGAYVVSDKDSDGNFIMYTTDTTHTWDTKDDGKGNRWVAYCFADAGHTFSITNANTCPRRIHIGRNVGTITSLVNGRVSEITVTDGNYLEEFNTVGHSQNWNPNVVLRNINKITGTTFTGSLASLYIDVVSSVQRNINSQNQTIGNVIIKADTYNASGGSDEGLLNGVMNSCIVNIRKTYYQTSSTNGRHGVVFLNQNSSLRSVSFLGLSEFMGMCFVRCSNSNSSFAANLKHFYLGYADSDKTKGIYPVATGGTSPTDIELQDGWLKPLNIRMFDALTKENVQAHIFDRLGVNDLSTGAVTITLATAVLNLFTQEEIDAVVARTNITIVGA